MANFPQIVHDLQERVEALEVRAEESEELWQRKWSRFIFLFRKMRESILRIEEGDTLERYHKSGAYTLGSLLRVPNAPIALQRMFESFQPPKRKGPNPTLAFEEIVNDGRNGIPNRAKPSRVSRPVRPGDSVPS